MFDRAELDALRATSTAKIILVTGPPCAGKTTYVQQVKADRDLVIDYDAIAVALGSPDSHAHPKSLVPYIIKARTTLLDRIAQRQPTTNVWIIACTPTQAERTLAHDTVVLATAATLCKERAAQLDRPATWPRLIDEWHATHAREACG